MPEQLSPEQAAHRYEVSRRQRAGLVKARDDLAGHTDERGVPCRICELEAASLAGLIADLDADLIRYGQLAGIRSEEADLPPASEVRP